MTTMKSHYAVLGVLPTAEDVVIRAAYKALAQRYHPDKYQGPKAEAEALMKELNAAYSVLSDPEKRRRYDEEQKSSSNQSYETEADSSEDGTLDDAMTALDEFWEVACKFYPDLNEIYRRLKKVNSTLAAMFKVYMLEFKAYQDRVQVALQMENMFLQRYFGSNPAIIKFAKELINAGNKTAARALNKYVTVMGDGIPSAMIVGKIRSEYNVPDPWIEAKKRAVAEQIERDERERKAFQEAKRRRAQELETGILASGEPTPELIQRLLLAVRRGDLEESLQAVTKCPKVVLRAKNSDGQSALHIAVIERQKKLVQFLVNRGASTAEKDNFGKTALDYLGNLNWLNQYKTY
jgi:curved DNA-binding protein CbpA